MTVQIGSFGPNFLKWTRDGFSIEDSVVLSVLLTAAGCVIAALGDFSFDLFGYGLALTSVFFQTMYLLLVEKSGAQDGLSSIEIMFYNSFLSLPFLSFLIIATGEFPNSVLLLLAKIRRGGWSRHANPALGFVLLGGVEVHVLNVSGLVLNTAGGVWYSYAKYRQKKAS
ncbi:hypothetical protein HID58_000587 [Brassica napus]|uniref:Sugar phosphate transporter domain-containing protein n=1 Tax=Brassica napus TaxID=3708 RepID=A0ABQ8EH67_BRANA|nr:hypothetical protein HID58_000587 [Brassica napus]